MKRNLIAPVAVLSYLGIYALSLLLLGRSQSFEAGEYLAVLLIFGIGLSVAAWLVTIGIKPVAAVVHQPGKEFGAIAGYLLLFSLLFLGWGLSALKALVTAEQPQEVVILLAKLAAMVLIPAWLFTRMGYRWRDLFGRFSLGSLGSGRSGWRVLIIMAVLLLGLQLLIGQGPKRIAALEQPGWLVAVMAPLALLWMSLEAGLTEEFLFRVLLQTRAAQFFRSETVGIVVMALLFGLAHAPGYVLRGAYAMEGMSGAPDVFTAMAYTVVVVSPIGLMFGVLWARTRNLLLLVLLHGWTDLIPNLAPFIKTWLG
ncbi:CPBP family intramembrane metalloprotease [Permianibacter sp. IMCC34836]|uniref:CPBP family intramembrane glutamic endopeptidase n=1 Tax=Permianibacter fluminis TaxID=2738515 RepID=UPI001551873F|nr:CPBP family intramembrane glutamic endopeptidase [Permianibacter fluminis]NQD36736.1 CPBP family intramembrane metalloprotease [Permianibacter fluminis]